jgi:hypothetical protein
VKPVPDISDQQNARVEPFADCLGFNAVTVRRDPVEPVPVGTIIAFAFRVTGYDPDCDGSLMARLEHIDFDGEATGWEPNCLGLYPDGAVILDDPDELRRLTS